MYLEYNKQWRIYYHWPVKIRQKQEQLKKEKEKNSHFWNGRKIQPAKIYRNIYFTAQQESSKPILIQFYLFIFFLEMLI